MFKVIHPTAAQLRAELAHVGDTVPRLEALATALEAFEAAEQVAANRGALVLCDVLQ